jgi:hypothetical protein
MFKGWKNTVTCLLCVGLMLFDLKLPSLVADQPTDYVWQIERIERAARAYTCTGFAENDVAGVFLDIPQQYFPLRLTEVHVSWQQPDGASLREVLTNVYFYRGSDRILKYFLEGVVLVPGKNIIRLGVECEECRAYFDESDGPGLVVLIEYLTEYENPVNPDSGHIITDDAGCWPGMCLIFDSARGDWIDLCQAGGTGNFAIRAKYTPLCPEKVGDTNGNLHIDLADFAQLQATASGSGVDVFSIDRSKIYPDLDNDMDVDAADAQILVGHYTGPAIEVVCPRDGGSGGGGPGSPVIVVTDPAAQGVPEALWQIPLNLAGPGPGSPRFDYLQAVLVTALIADLVFCLRLAYKDSESARDNDKLDFVQDVARPTSAQMANINDGLAYLQNMSIDDPGWRELTNMCVAWYQEEANMRAVFISHRDEDHVSLLATHIQVNHENRITLHRTWVNETTPTPPIPVTRFDQFRAAGVAVVLFGEWEHIAHPNWDENTCNNEFIDWAYAVHLTAQARGALHGYAQ